MQDFIILLICLLIAGVIVSLVIIAVAMVKRKLARNKKETDHGRRR